MEVLELLELAVQLIRLSAGRFQVVFLLRRQLVVPEEFFLVAMLVQLAQGCLVAVAVEAVALLEESLQMAGMAVRVPRGLMGRLFSSGNFLLNISYANINLCERRNCAISFWIFIKREGTRSFLPRLWFRKTIRPLFLPAAACSRFCRFF